MMSIILAGKGIRFARTPSTHFLAGEAAASAPARCKSKRLHCLFTETCGWASRATFLPLCFCNGSGGQENERSSLQVRTPGSNNCITCKIVGVGRRKLERRGAGAEHQRPLTRSVKIQTPRAWRRLGSLHYRRVSNRVRRAYAVLLSPRTALAHSRQQNHNSSGEK